MFSMLNRVWVIYVRHKCNFSCRLHKVLKRRHFSIHGYTGVVGGVRILVYETRFLTLAFQTLKLKMMTT